MSSGRRGDRDRTNLARLAAIVRALAYNPRLLLLDEVTSALTWEVNWIMAFTRLSAQ